MVPTFTKPDIAESDGIVLYCYPHNYYSQKVCVGAFFGWKIENFQKLSNISIIWPFFCLSHRVFTFVSSRMFIYVYHARFVVISVLAYIEMVIFEWLSFENRPWLRCMRSTWSFRFTRWTLPMASSSQSGSFSWAHVGRFQCCRMDFLLFQKPRRFCTIWIIDIGFLVGFYTKN